VRWHLHRQEAGEALSTDLGELLGDSTETVGFALTHVRCAEPTDAMLLLSTSKTGAAYVNGEEVLRDGTATGLMLGEHRVPVHLNEGWNSVSIKCVSHWAGPQSFAAALTSRDGGRPPGLTVSAPGGQAAKLPTLPHGTR
jgi:hypothetical protein